MAPTDVEGHFKFLISCIKHSAAGKVNFGAVAEELGIVSKAAAAKRYERLLKAHDIAPAPATPKKSAGDPVTPTKGSARKRKVPKVEKTEDDDEEVKSEGNEEKKPVKRESKRAKTADYKSSEYVNDDDEGGDDDEGEI